MVGPWSQLQGSKLLGFWMSGKAQNGNGNPILGPGVQTGNPEIAGEIQTPRQVSQMETQILIEISSSAIGLIFNPNSLLES